MSILKSLPISYLGELHQIRLINFYVDYDEVCQYVQAPLVVRRFPNNKALISMVNVDLHHIHPSFLPEAAHVDYRHVGFRLLLDDSPYNNGESKGIFFLRSFTTKPVVAWAGKLLTNYRLERAEIICLDQMMELRQGDKYLNYALDLHDPGTVDCNLQETIAQLDRAYSVEGKEVSMVKIMRERWPIRPVNAYLFETNFFESATFAGAFVVDDVIPYQWLAAQHIDTCA
jgi:Uncharacterized conserved protein (COG2071)